MDKQHHVFSVRHPRRALVGGLSLALIGIVMACEQLGYHLPQRWIALILVVPGSAAILDSLKLVVYHRNQGLQALARGIAGLLFIAIGIFLFEGINTGLLLPSLMIAVGLVVFGRAILRDSRARRRSGE
jgi:uncharacterized membrane protein HdeD (DUF308 family)